ncbi:transposase [Streptomyces sp. NPDC088097]|uniref:transposase n=1 Tax=Streptomyces sp. NPDC088097 TaxID=3365823 RepID=UPI0037F94455
MMRHPDRLRDEDREQLAEILTTRSGQHLKDWINAVRAEDLPGLHSFATGLEKDWDAVIQGLTSHWNSGPVEGRVNHIKMIKRQMFGRAKLPCSANASFSPHQQTGDPPARGVRPLRHARPYEQRCFLAAHRRLQAHGT